MINQLTTLLRSYLIGAIPKFVYHGQAPIPEGLPRHEILLWAWLKATISQSWIRMIYGMQISSSGKSNLWKSIGRSVFSPATSESQAIVKEITGGRTSEKAV